MKPITKLASSTLPDGSVLDLWERDGFHFLLRDGVQTASSFSHGSNEAAAAMAAALPLRFEQNMAAFRQHIPHIADIYEAYQPTRPFRFFCNENGIPNLLWLEDRKSVV